MRNNTIYFFVVFLVALGAGWIVKYKTNKVENDLDRLMNARTVIDIAKEDILKSPDGTQIINPKANSKIKSPVKVYGKAPGNWFFEGSLIIKITDENGNVEGYGPATALEDYMTDSLVRFEAIIPFEAFSSRGYVLVEAYNPSGLIKNYKSYSIPVILDLEEQGGMCNPGKIAGTCAKTETL